MKKLNVIIPFISIALFAALSSFTAAQANSSDLCSTIAIDPETEAEFALNQSDEYLTGRLRYFKTSFYAPGTCFTPDIGLSQSGKKAEMVDLNCGYNGCGFGGDMSFLNWRGHGYIISKSRYKDHFERLKGWESLSSEEQARLKFRNTAYELYEISTHNKYQANSICESYLQNDEYREKSLVNNSICNDLAANKITSIFPAGKYINSGQMTPDISRLVHLDVNGDGLLEHLAPAASYSGAGCGCDTETIMLFDDEGKPIDDQPNETFVGQLHRFLSQTGCRETIDIIEFNGQYYLEKRVGNRKRLQSRELYSLSGENIFQPICAYINETPLNWTNVKADQ